MLVSLFAEIETKVLAGISIIALALLFLLGKGLIVSGFDQMIIILLGGIFLFPMYLVARLVTARRPFTPAPFLKTPGLITLALAVSILYVSLVYGDTLKAKWALIDDSEIKFFLGGQDHLALSDLLPRLLQTEVGSFGVSTRFRPFYYFMRLLECVLWGNHPVPWYLFRMGILTFSLFSFWILIKPLLGWLGAGLLCLSAAASTYLVELFGRLGPGETYTVAGLAIFIAGFVGIVHKPDHPQRKYFNNLLILLGTVICVGSKENFVLLILPLLYLLYDRGRMRDYRSMVFIGVGLVYSMWITVSIILALSKSHVDFYANPVSMGERWFTFWEAFRNPNLVVVFLILLGFMLLPGALLGFKKYRYLKKNILVAQFLILAIIAFLIAQFVFYNGRWPYDSRYDFPGMLFIPALILVIWWFISCLISGKTFENPIRIALNLSLVFSLTFFILLKGFGPQIQRVKESVNSTIEFSDKIERIVSLLKKNENSVLVLEGESYLDYEPVFSYARFLEAENIKNKIVYRFHGTVTENAASNLEKRLILELHKISAEGNEYITPLSGLAQFGNRCFSVNLSGRYYSNCIPIE